MKQAEIKAKVATLIAENERLEKEYDDKVVENEKEMRAYFDSIILEYKKYSSEGTYSSNVSLGYEFRLYGLCDELTGGCGDYDWNLSYDKLTRENLDKMKEAFLKRKRLQDEVKNSKERDEYLRLRRIYGQSDK